MEENGKVELYLILVLLCLCTLSCSFSKNYKGGNHLEIRVEDSVLINICVLKAKDSLPTDALISFENGGQKITGFNNDKGCISFNVIPKEWLYFQVYSDRFEGVYEVNPFLHVTKSGLDTTIYLREYKEISDQFYRD